MKGVYLLKSRCIIAQPKSYKNAIKHSLQFTCLFVLLVENSLSYEYFRPTRRFGPTWTHIYSQNVESIYSSYPAESCDRAWSVY